MAQVQAQAQVQARLRGRASDGHLERMKRTSDRLGEVSEEMMSKGFGALESLTQLTRDNLASGRLMAKEWRDLGAESLRRQVELMTPSWLR